MLSTVMSNTRVIARVLVGVTAAVSTVTLIGGIVYMDKRLHAVTSNYKFGPVRHVQFLSAVAHRLNRLIGDAAIETWRDAMNEDAEYYQRLEDAHERLLEDSKVRKDE